MTKHSSPPVVTVTITGEHRGGKSTIATLLRLALRWHEIPFEVVDVDPSDLPQSIPGLLRRGMTVQVVEVASPRVQVDATGKHPIVYVTEPLTDPRLHPDYERLQSSPRAAVYDEYWSRFVFDEPVEATGQVRLTFPNMPEALRNPEPVSIEEINAVFSDEPKEELVQTKPFCGLCSEWLPLPKTCPRFNCPYRS